MKLEETRIRGCVIVHPDPVIDERGWFARIFCESDFEPYFGKLKFVQINHSFNIKKGTFRGMHYQEPPFTEGKLVRCVAGRVVDFVLDVRNNSPSFLQFASIELSAKNKQMVYIPGGIAHGFQTLEDNSELIYHHTEFYNKEADKGIRYDDPMVRIGLPFQITSISEKDKSYPFLTNNFKGIEL